MFNGMKYVYAVYKEGSFSKAAESLFISQPSLSANIKREEDNIGYPIFDRSTKPLSLTECGKEYIRAAEQIMSVNQHFEVYLSDMEGLRAGSLSIGGTNLFASWILPELLSDFSLKYPNVEIELVEETSHELEHMLQSGRIDMLLDNSKLDSAIYEHKVYMEEYLLLAVPAGFDVNERLKGFQLSHDMIEEGKFLSADIPTVSLKEFANVPFVLLKQGNDTGERARAICRENCFTPEVLFELDQQMTSYNITISGMAISFISDTLIRRVPFHEKVVYYKLSGKNVRRNLSFYWKSGRYKSRAMEEFLKGL